MQKQRLKTIVSIALISTTSLLFAANTTPQQHALIIGISDYQGVSKLANAVNDADKMANFFQTDLGVSKENIIRLSDAKATRENILNALESLQEKAKKDDEVLIYYSGHGSQIRDKNEDEDDGWDETLVSYDTYAGDNGVWKNMITDDELDAALTKIEDKGAKTVMITDACHSGSITRSLPSVKNVGLPEATSKDMIAVIPTDNYQKRRKEDPFLNATESRTEWSAASAGQVTYESALMGGGVFTRYFLEGYQDKKADQNKDDIVSNSELIHYLQEKLQQYCTNNKQCSDLGLNLTPELTITPNRYGEPVFAQRIQTKPSQSAVETNKRGKMLAMLEQTLPLSQPDQLSISIVEGDKLKLGQDIFVKIKSKKDGYLILLDLDAKGDLVQVFPNQYHEDNAIKANDEVFIPQDALQPYAMTVDEAGQSHLYAIVTYDKVELSDIITQNKDLTPVPKPNIYVSEIADRLSDVWQGEPTNRSNDYSVARFDYFVGNK